MECLLADFRHLCDAQGWAWGALDKAAHQNYLSDLNGFPPANADFADESLAREDDQEAAEPDAAVLDEGQSEDTALLCSGCWRERSACALDPCPVEIAYRAEGARRVDPLAAATRYRWAVDTSGRETEVLLHGPEGIGAIFVCALHSASDEFRANVLCAINNHADLVNALQGLLDLCHEEGLDEGDDSPLIANAKGVVAQVLA
jgi:hypothetical protein